MTVSELIGQLKRLPADAPVEIWSFAVEGWWEVKEIGYDPDDPNTTTWPNKTPSVRIS